MFQLFLSRKGVETHWGVIKRSLIGEPELESCANALLGNIASDYHLSMSCFKTIKAPTQWFLASLDTLALELKPSVSLYETQVTIRQYPVQVVETLQKGKHLLELVRAIIQKSQPPIYPLAVQILFQPARPGSTRLRKKKRRGGETWTEDYYKITKQEVQIAEHQRGKTYGYYKVTVRILAPKRAKHLLAVVNKEFSFKQVSARKAIDRFNHQAFGKKVGMSSLTLNRLLNVPTGDIFSRELLKAPTVSHSRGRTLRTRPYPTEGYLLGYDEDQQEIYLTDAELRSHIIITGITGHRKSSTVRAFIPELTRNWQNRVLIIDTAGEYTDLIQEGFVLLRPGSEEFPIGINFLDWCQTLGLDEQIILGWVMKILRTFVRGKGELTPKMGGMLQQAVQRALRRGGTLLELLSSLESLWKDLGQAKSQLKLRRDQGEKLDREEHRLIDEYDNYGLTVEALLNRLIDLYQSPMRQVFYVEQTTLTPDDLLTQNIIIDLKILQEQETPRELLQVFIEFFLLFLFQGAIRRKKGQFATRNIIVIEEAQLLAPEVFNKPTAIDGTTSETFLGALGGFGMSMVFIAAQPQLLSKAVLAGCHTKLVFGTTSGPGSERVAALVGADLWELARLDPGEAFLTTKGRETIKIRTQSKPIISMEEQAQLEAWLQANLPPLLEKSLRTFQIILKEPRSSYSETMDLIERTIDNSRRLENGNSTNEARMRPDPSKQNNPEVTQTQPPQERDIAKAGNPMRCWFFDYCGICTKSVKILDDATILAEQFWKKKTKAELHTRLNHYSTYPQIVFKEIRELAAQKKVPAPELTAFCAHQIILKRCKADPVISEHCRTLFSKEPREIAYQFVDDGIREILNLRHFYDTPTTFSHKDEFCLLCPLDRSLRNDFCHKYRKSALDLLKDPVQTRELKAAYQLGFDFFLSRLFEVSKNPSFAFCLGTTILRGVHITANQKRILKEKMETFLIAWEQTRPSGETRLCKAAVEVRRIIAEDMLEIDVGDLSLKKATRLANAINGGKAWENAKKILNAAVVLDEQGEIPASFNVTSLPDMLGELYRWPWWFTPYQREQYLTFLREDEQVTPIEGCSADNIQKGEKSATASSVATTPELERTLDVIETIFAQNDGIVSRREFEQQLRAKDLYSTRTFYKIIRDQIGAWRFSVAIQKREQDPRHVTPETHYVSPAYYEIQKSLDLFRVMHDFIMREVKNFLSVTCAVKDVSRETSENGKTIISDLPVSFNSRKTYVEYTSGGREAMRKVIQKTAESRNNYVILVGIETPPRRRQSGMGVKSNKQEALKIAAELGVKVRVFTLTNLSELEAWCMRGRLPYSQGKK